jgi:hypothetical protein
MESSLLGKRLGVHFKSSRFYQELEVATINGRIELKKSGRRVLGPKGAPPASSNVIKNNVRQPILLTTGASP